jgi:outer membrane immunogenic protein
MGFEVDWSHSGVDGASSVAPLLLFSGAPDTGSSQTTSTDLKWLATARLRLGTAIGAQAMAYVTGGAALGKVEYNVVTDYVGDAFRYPGSLSKNRLGWTVGGGMEFGLSSNMSLKAEYLYFDLGDNTIIANPVAPNAPFQVQTVHDLNGHIIRLGLNIRFGDTGAVVARY